SALSAAAGMESADGREQIHMGGADLQGLTAAHGESRDGAVFAVGFGAQLANNGGDELLDHDLLKERGLSGPASSTSSATSAAATAVGVRGNRRLSGRRGVAVVHDDDHRHGLFLSDQ